MIRQYRVAIILLTCLWLLAPTTSVAQQFQSIAILDLEGRGISTTEAASLTDRLRNALVRTGGITIVERGQMEQILSEQNFQLTGCTSNECAVEVGQLLGVTSMLAGSIGLVGSTYSIDIRTVDVQSGQITNSLWRDYRGEIDGLLGLMPEIADELVSAMGTAAAPEPEPLAPALVSISSEPAGAQVMLDSRDAGVTPLEQVELEAGRSHLISLSRDRYQSVDTTLFVETGLSYELNFPMDRLPSRLTVTSNPPGAMVYLDGQQLQATPLEMPELIPDMQHLVSLRLPGYLPMDTTFMAWAGDHHQLNIALRSIPAATTAARPQETPPETQQQQPAVTSERRGRGGFYLLVLLAGTGYYGYTQGWFDEWLNPPEKELRVGNPPSVPAP